jgi:excisionase family DNA binding protein
LVSVDEAAERIGRGRRTIDRWISLGLLTPYKKRGDRHTNVDLAELPEAMRRAGRPGPKPRERR